MLNATAQPAPISRPSSSKVFRFPDGRAIAFAPALTADHPQNFDCGLYHTLHDGTTKIPESLEIQINRISGAEPHVKHSRSTPAANLKVRHGHTHYTSEPRPDTPGENEDEVSIR
jgi:hypothetical protein